MTQTQRSKLIEFREWSKVIVPFVTIIFFAGKISEQLKESANKTVVVIDRAPIAFDEIHDLNNKFIGFIDYVKQHNDSLFNYDVYKDFWDNHHDDYLTSKKFNKNLNFIDYDPL